MNIVNLRNKTERITNEANSLLDEIEQLQKDMSQLEDFIDCDELQAVCIALGDVFK